MLSLIYSILEIIVGILFAFVAPTTTGLLTQILYYACAVTWVIWGAIGIAKFVKHKKDKIND
jgi:uncharacterized membrane protein HdeD (DUF308 family)